MKKSIGARMAIAFAVLMVTALVIMGLANKLLLNRYYYSEKQEILVDSLTKLNADEEAVNTDEFNNFCSENSLVYAYTNSSLSEIITNSSDGEGMAGRLLGHLLSMDEKNTTVLEQTDSYQVTKIHDQFLGIDFLELWGTTDAGNYFIVRCPISSMDTAADISMRFFLYIGIIVTLISCIVIYFLSKRIVKPVRELAGISQRMAQLDFDARYTSGGEDEIGVLGKNFNEMSDKLEQAITELKNANTRLQKELDEKVQIEEMRTIFLSDVSHELKTPIALIQGYAEGLSDFGADDPESMEYYCEVIVDEANRMNQLVKKLLNLNQLEFGKDQLSPERFDLCELIHGKLSSTDILIQKNQAHVTFNTEGPIMVLADEFKIEEVVTNYLTNALNHLDGERQVEISCQIAGNQVITRVYNTGKPIPEDELEKVWVKFYKVDKARTRAYGGSGIGLSIVKAIMDAHKEECWVRNEENGVAFYFTLALSE
ncbi:MAG: HAMP domain-containing sensor histidine kinase [Lachnospiraceae bacterium]|nr:HAMP domain-containing sensor histidine kinase [Lachnospiraceae bacterium]